MNTEQQLKDLVINKYGSIRNFALQIEMPYSTVDSIFKRGILNASVTNIIRICDVLEISVDSLSRGIVAAKVMPDSATHLTAGEQELLHIFRSLNTTGKELLLAGARGYDGNPELKQDESKSQAI